jgi:hypothetical protein
MSVILYPKAHSTNFFRINNFIEIAKPPDRNSAQVQRPLKDATQKKRQSQFISTTISRSHNTHSRDYLFVFLQQ